MENIKELLPIGTVVILKDATKRLMISGVMQNDTEEMNMIIWEFCILKEISVRMHSFISAFRHRTGDFQRI